MTDQTRPRWRSGSVFTASFRAIDRNARARIIFLAEALDRRTRQPGQHGGCLKRSGLAVLRTLMFHFMNHSTGRLDPSLEQLADKAGIARSTAAEAITRLETAGLLDRVRRVARQRTRDGITRLVQITNAYRLNVPRDDRPIEGDLAAPLKRRASESDYRPASNQVIKPIPPESFADFAETELGRALARLGHTLADKKEANGGAAKP